MHCLLDLKYYLYLFGNPKFIDTSRLVPTLQTRLLSVTDESCEQAPMKVLMNLKLVSLSRDRNYTAWHDPREGAPPMLQQPGFPASGRT